MYNAASTIVDALESVRIQNYGNDLEIIIINDGSNDNSLDIAAKYRLDHPYLNIEIISKENGGAAGARNAGIRAANGDFIALLDADDEWLENKLKILMPYFNNKEIDCIGSGRNGKPLKVGFKDIKELTRIYPADLVFRWNPCTPSVIFRKSIIKKIGLYNETLSYAEDCEYWGRIAHYCGFYVIPDSLVITGHGKHDYGQSGLSNNLMKMHKGELYAINNAYSIGGISWVVCCLAKIFARIKYIRRINILLLRKFIKVLLSGQTLWLQKTFFQI
jgi:glycosyltransferase involved in cell wall biosynthesis